MITSDEQLRNELLRLASALVPDEIPHSSNATHARPASKDVPRELVSDAIVTEIVPADRRRNRFLAVAALVLLISTAGAALVVGSGRDKGSIPAESGGRAALPATSPEAPQWVGGFEMIVYITPGADQTEIGAIHDALASTPDIVNVDRLVYLDPQQAVAEASKIFADDPGALALLNTTNIPTEFKIVPQAGRRADLHALSASLSALAGVQAIRFADDPQSTTIPTTDTPGPTTTVAAETSNNTIQSPLVVSPGKVVIADASGVVGAGKFATLYLSTLGFSMHDSSNAISPVEPLDDTHVYYEPGSEQVAASVAQVLSLAGSPIMPTPMPAPIPVVGGTMDDATVLVVLGKSSADVGMASTWVNPIVTTPTNASVPATPIADPDRPAHQSPSAFDSGAAVIVYMSPNATPGQIDAARATILSSISAGLGEIDPNTLEYLDSAQAQTEARRVYANNEPLAAQVNASTVPTMFRLYPTTATTADGLQQLVYALSTEIPNVDTIATPTTPSSDLIPLHPAPAGETKPTMAPLTT